MYAYRILCCRNPMTILKLAMRPKRQPPGWLSSTFCIRASFKVHISRQPLSYSSSPNFFPSVFIASSMMPSRITLDFDPFATLHIDLDHGSFSTQDIARLKREAFRRLVRTGLQDGIMTYQLSTTSQKLINCAAEALERYPWTDLVAWGRKQGYGTPKQVVNTFCLLLHL